MHLGDMQFHAFTVHANLLGVNRQISNRDSNSAHFAVPTTPPLLRLEHPGARHVAPEPWAALLEQRLRALAFPFCLRGLDPISVFI